ncbi:unnamed protein product [Thelazia callipaeda]|uniref:DH domain-containing protein n=1 Tax=Thelazia callipaeda TaxID=103827 RepID=A0A0N5CXH5_THECL|nr:unnamed protein product [Thelazia callipaeda]
MHDLNQIPQVDVKQRLTRVENEQQLHISTTGKVSSCSNIIERRKLLYEGGETIREQKTQNLKQKPTVPRKPCRSPSAVVSSLIPVDTTNVDVTKNDPSVNDTASLTRSSVLSNNSWTESQTSGSITSEAELSWGQNSSCFKETVENIAEKTLTIEKTNTSDLTLDSEEIAYHSDIPATEILKAKSDEQIYDSSCERLVPYDSITTSSRPSSDACSIASSLCLKNKKPIRSSFDHSIVDASYNTGCSKEDQRLRKLHYAAVEIFSVEKNFVEQLQFIAVKYPKYLVEYGRQLGIDLLKPLPDGHPHLINRIAQQLVMVKEAHKLLLERFSSKIENWDSRNPCMAECLKNGAPLLKCCLPYLKEKKKHVDEFVKLLQDNEELARATWKFEEQVMGKISIIQQLDIVHQNVVRYTILLGAYKKYLLPDSEEFEECEEALIQLLNVSELVDRQISLAELEKRLINLYRRLEGRFNVFEANRHLLFEGELMKQSRKDLQPRYLILFSDVLLICKYSRTPSLGADANFHSNFYKCLVSRTRVNAEEHGEYETHFQLYTTQKSAVFIAKTKRERDEWVKRISEAKIECKRLRRIKAVRNKNLNFQVSQNEESTNDKTSDVQTSQDGLDQNIPLVNVPVSEKYKYTPLWIPDPKATSCMMAGCSTKFGVLNRRHHCRECGYVSFLLICRSCVGYAPVKTGGYYVRTKVCPECYVKIIKKYKVHSFILGQGVSGNTIFTAPENESLIKTNILSRNDEGVVSGTVFLRNQKGNECEKWGRLTSHIDDILVLSFYDAEFDADPVARYVLLGFTLCVQELDDGGRLFELRHVNQVNGRSTITLHFRVAHSGNARRFIFRKLFT